MTSTTLKSSAKTTTATSSVDIIPLNPAIAPGTREPSRTFEKFKEGWLLQIMGDSGVPAGAKLVAVVIGSHMNRHRQRYDAFPSFARLTRLTVMSRRNVIRAVKHLEAAGHVEVRRSKAGKTGKKNNANVYYPILKGPALADDETFHPNCHHLVTRVSPT